MFEKGIIVLKKNKYNLLAIIDYIIFALSNVFMKISSTYNGLIDKFIWYAFSIICLMAFSLIWQILLKYLPLNKAYLFKGTTLLWGMLFGILIFNEQLTINMIIGILIVIFGIIVAFTGGEYNE